MSLELSLVDVVVVLAAIGGPIATFAVLGQRVKYLEREVGEDHESGLRGARHKHAGVIQEHEGRLDNHERRIKTLERTPRE